MLQYLCKLRKKGGDIMDIKTYPIQMDREFHLKLKKAALHSGKYLKDFISDVLKEAVEKELKE